MKRCPPGVICLENTTIFFIFIIIFILSYFVFFKSPEMNTSNNKYSSFVQSHNDYNTNNIPIMPSSLPIDFPMNQNIAVRRSPQFSTSDVRGDVLLNPYAPPANNEMYYMPINVRTQGHGYDATYRQIGILTSNNNKEVILPLMGRPLISGRDMWQYYTMSEKNNIKLPISRGKRSCTNEYGCDKLYDGDNVFVQGYNDVFNVNVYDNDVIRYLPVI